MDSTALLSVVGGALFLSIILVASLCTNCLGQKQQTSIPQRSSDSEYNQISSFGLRYPMSTYEHHMDHTRTGPYQPNSLTSPSITVTKVPSCPPSETGSQASYVNQNESDDEPDVQPPSEYIVVLPDSPNTLSQRPSRASSQSSDIPDYENCKNSIEQLCNYCGLSRGSQSSDERDSSDYVNTRDVTDLPFI
ncbi:linker for activation of T-cells family member 1 isoform X4 [Onychostoma macrolepis]|uniref:linker for activation of T-cells family member 1 isoform X4 n=1 Tax=Onychostoma macrolepis TaxID=369639 RepID=UPI00272B3D3F|nr:linker for activation of T-cells family member 1 isoform X4 [Onychostoma macrolepis]